MQVYTVRARVVPCNEEMEPQGAGTIIELEYAEDPNEHFNDVAERVIDESGRIANADGHLNFLVTEVYCYTGMTNLLPRMIERQKALTKLSRQQARHDWLKETHKELCELPIAVRLCVTYKDADEVVKHIEVGGFLTTGEKVSGPLAIEHIDSWIETVVDEELDEDTPRPWAFLKGNLQYAAFDEENPDEEALKNPSLFIDITVFDEDFEDKFNKAGASYAPGG